MDYVVQLTQATDAKNVGGKAANLGRLLMAGVPIPPGFAVTTEAFTDHMKDGDTKKRIEICSEAIQKGASVEELELISTEIRRAIQRTKLKDGFAEQLTSACRSLRAPFVAVRSSATVEDGSTAAWAGQLESYLYVDNETGMRDAVLNCWASLYSPRALSYRLAQGMLQRPVAVAVLVQFMVTAEKSGVAFTADPIANDPNMFVVESVWGDCEQLVSGQITPDSYYLNKKLSQVTAIKTAVQDTCRSRGREVSLPVSRATQRKLSDSEILQLSQLCARVEEYFGKPQDIEWVFDGRSFFIVQARPITTFELKL